MTECRSYNKGENHPFFGRKHTSETLEKMRKVKLGKLNPQWKGDSVKYDALHEWVNIHKPKPELCETCNIKPPLDLANITGIYNRNMENWKHLCRRCHMLSDGRMKNLVSYRGD